MEAVLPLVKIVTGLYVTVQHDYETKCDNMKSIESEDDIKLS